VLHGEVLCSSCYFVSGGMSCHLDHAS
jgi:hypothetical protein